jgi:hypothetical protein
MVEDERLPAGREHLTEARLFESESLRQDDGGARLTVEQILMWADAHHAAHGAWPEVRPDTLCGEIAGAPGESWKAINNALCFGLRGLPGDSSLAELLAEHRGVPLPDMSAKALAEKIWAWEQEEFRVKGPRRRAGARSSCPPLTIDAILAWADAHHAQTGTWPTKESGRVGHAPFELTWQRIESALRKGHRGLLGGQSLGGLLGKHRELRPRLTVERILEWADAYHAGKGAWPTHRSGRIEGTSEETWRIVDRSLREGGHGLPGGQSLARLLFEHRGARFKGSPLLLGVEQILAWADAHHAAHGQWPRADSGPVDGIAGETWRELDRALMEGWRGLPGGTRLSWLLAEHRGASARLPAPKLKVEQVLAWADAYHEATGNWPTRGSGPIAGTDEVWSNVCDALKRGHRGLPRSGSLAELLSRERQARSRAAPPPLTVEQVLAWADAHHAAHGRWPTTMSGRVPGVPEESWGGIGAAVVLGRRGLPGGTTLARLLATHRPTRSSVLTLETVRACAEAHRKATGFWPGRGSGPVLGVPGETWGTIDGALRLGYRGLPGGMTLATLRAESSDPGPPRPDTPLTAKQIRTWALQHHARTGQWPTPSSGPIEGAPGEDWTRIAEALISGKRGLTDRITLAEFIHQNLDPSVPIGKRQLTIEEILAWANAHKQRTGRWPVQNSGALPDEPGLTWSIIHTCLRKGHRGVGPGLSLRRLLAEYRGATGGRGSRGGKVPSDPARGTGRE